MKKLMLLCVALLLLPGLDVWGAGRNGGAPAARPAMARPAMAARPASQPRPAARQPVVINMSRGSSGGHNRNYPSQQRSVNHQVVSHQPSYGQLHWNNTTAAQSPRPNIAPENPKEGVVTGQATSRPSVQNYVQPGVKAAVVVHHHAYAQGYVRQKLQKMGVSTEPNLITDRSEMIETDKAHSTIKVPQRGADHQAITAAAVSPRHFNDSVVRNQMNIVDSPEWQARADQYNASENQTGHYYWHNDAGVNYCHYLDNSGYNWYGWYVGDQYFWTRNFNGRWWQYDSDYGRWCFWNNGYWWWQDPNHVGDLYCYDNNDYIPCNSADDQVVVTASDSVNMQSYASPDGTRVVKIDPTSQDAFLYDTANPPSFDPVYMASGVESVEYSDSSSGRPLEIILKLNDGSFDMFDSQGNAYNPGLLDADEAKQDDAPPAPPSPGDSAVTN